ncbi:IPT/TIG domain-containing protein [Chloroflexota bacterium]
MKNGKTRSLAVAISLSLLVLLIPSTPVLAAPVITLSPDFGARGTMVTVTGTNFESYRGDDIYIFLDNDEVTTGPLVVPEVGSFTFSFNIPEDADSGEHSIRAKSEFGSTLARSTFTVAKCEIKLDTKFGPVGTRVTINGEGFYADKVVTLYYENRTREILGTRAATANGEFSYSFVIPDSPAGKHEISAENTEDNSAEAEFEVIPLITLDPITGAVSEILTVSGTGFGSRDDVDIYFQYDEVAYAKTSEYGNFEAAFFNVPAMKPGTYEVKVEDGDGNVATTDFTIIAGASLDKTTGNVGMELSVIGTGFEPGATVTIEYDGAEIATAVADSEGAFEAGFQMPRSKYGDHTITVTDGVTIRQLTFAVESEAPSVPRLLLPFGASEAKAEAQFNWSDVTDPSKPVTYHLQVASDESFATIVLDREGLTDPEYTLTKGERLAAVKKEAPYYWRVKAIDSAANESKWSNPRSFYVAAPPAPELLLPETGIKADAETYFDWKDVTDLSPPITYYLQIASDKNFTSIVLEKTGLANSEYTLTEEEKLGAVKKEVPYYWRVKAIDSVANQGEWSAPWSFYVGFTMPGWVWYILIGLGVLLAGFIAFLLGRRTAYYQS